MLVIHDAGSTCACGTLLARSLAPQVVGTVWAQLSQAGLTILVGVVVYVLGQFVVGTIVEPVKEQRRLVAEVAAALTLYANLYTNFGVASGQKPDRVDQVTWDEIVTNDRQRNSEASRAMRELSSRLQGHNLSIPWYGLVRWLHLAPSRERTLRAGSALIGISNMTPARDHDDIRQNLQWRQQILHDLGLIRLHMEAPKQR